MSHLSMAVSFSLIGSTERPLNTDNNAYMFISQEMENPERVAVHLVIYLAIEFVPRGITIGAFKLVLGEEFLP